MKKKDGIILSWWSEQEDKIFSNSAKEVDGFFNKLKLLVLQSFAVIIDALLGTRVITHSASMTYFTIMVSVPFVTMILLLSNDWVGLSEQLEVVVGYTLGDGIYDKIEQSAISSIDYENNRYGGFVIFVILMTVIFIRSFFLELQRGLDKIWGCTDRTFPSADVCGLLTAIFMMMGISVWGWLLPASSNAPSAAFFFSVVLLGMFLWGAYYFIPNSRKVGVSPSLIAAFICSTSLIFLWRIVPSIALRTNGYKNLAVLFTVLFVVFTSWFIFFLVAELCSVWDRSNDKYLKGNVEQISPLFRDILIVYTAAYVFKTFQYCHRRVTMDQIRRGMFTSHSLDKAVPYDRRGNWKKVKESRFRDICQSLDDNGYLCLFKDEFDEKKYVRTATLEEAEDIASLRISTGKSYLPISLMNEILGILVKQNILDYEDGISFGKTYRYYYPKGNSEGDYKAKPRMDPDSVTVGDIFFQLRMAGRHSLKYNYSSSPIKLADQLRDAEIDFFRSQSYPLKDLCIETKIEEIVHNYRISAEESFWNLYKQSTDYSDIKKYLDQYLPVFGKDEYIRIIQDLENDDPLLNGFDKETLIEIVKNSSDTAAQQSAGESQNPSQRRFLKKRM